MLFNYLTLAAETAGETAQNDSFMGKYGILLVLGAFFIIMIVMTILPQKKRQKQMQEMMSNLVVGAKVMTIGRMIGKVVSIDGENNQLVLNVGSTDSPTYVTIDRAAVGYVMDSPAKAVEAEAQKAVEAEAQEVEETKEDDLKI